MQRVTHNCNIKPGNCNFISCNRNFISHNVASCLAIQHYISLSQFLSHSFSNASNFFLVNVTLYIVYYQNYLLKKMFHAVDIHLPQLKVVLTFVLKWSVEHELNLWPLALKARNISYISSCSGGARPPLRQKSKNRPFLHRQNVGGWENNVSYNQVKVFPKLLDLCFSPRQLSASLMVASFRLLIYVALSFSLHFLRIVSGAGPSQAWGHTTSNGLGLASTFLVSVCVCVRASWLPWHCETCSGVPDMPTNNQSETYTNTCMHAPLPTLLLL